jgi:hypothetical protein
MPGHRSPVFFARGFGVYDFPALIWVSWYLFARYLASGVYLVASLASGVYLIASVDFPATGSVASTVLQG